jgi:putative oxygen-independent coproporphyrinogen III oxidase
MDDMVSAISKELRLKKEYLAEDIDTIYFGGGTPSLLSSAQISFLLDEINRTYQINPAAEITLEANPEDISLQKASALLGLGINRVSLGVQSFEDKILKSLHRVHTKDDAISAIQILQDVGFSNITIDLIYGIPDQGSEEWQLNLARAVKLSIPHISCYALTIEEKTAFGNWLKKGRLTPIKDSKYEEEYMIMCEYLAVNGYTHYEVSNFAMPGLESQHNSAYWQQKPYLGLGPGAHSYNRESRQYNVSNNATYIKGVERGNLVDKIEILCENQAFNEYVMTSIRTNRGIDLIKVKQDFGQDLVKKHHGFLSRCSTDKLLSMDQQHIILTDKGMILADSIIIELMNEV